MVKPTIFLIFAILFNVYKGNFNSTIYKYMQPTILAIETSCDDTSAAVIQDGKILANIVSSQLVHAAYGGVIPEVASRNHDLNIWHVVETALIQSKTELKQVDAIAVTMGPGLLGALLVGTTFAKTLSWANNKPLIGINHLEAHISAHFIENKSPQFPMLCLLVSGGHTQLVLVYSFTEMQILGQTIDDAAGEAYDKCAKLLGLPYPGGPVLDKLAQHANPLEYSFPLPKVEGLNFSFSGLKTSFLYFLQKKQIENPAFLEEEKENLCASIQHTINLYLTKQLQKAIDLHKPASIAIAGGVSANSDLRKKLKELAEKNNIPCYIPKFEYCTDNAAMIAMSAHFKFLDKKFESLDTVPYTRS
jgi:N6-L-threonylcarbamoyladenine synthase